MGLEEKATWRGVIEKCRFFCKSNADVASLYANREWIRFTIMVDIWWNKLLLRQSPSPTNTQPKWWKGEDTHIWTGNQVIKPLLWWYNSNSPFQELTLYHFYLMIAALIVCAKLTIFVVYKVLKKLLNSVCIFWRSVGQLYILSESQTRIKLITLSRRDFRSF